MLISIDPGVRGCGCALFEGQELINASYVRNPIKHGQDVDSAQAMAMAVVRWAENDQRIVTPQTKRLVIECPKVYHAAFQKGDQNTSIIPLTLVVGAVVGAFSWASAFQFFPRDWKGTADADLVTIPLIKERLSEIERGRVQLPAESLAHNVWDGVGVGLKFLGRLEPKRVFHKEPR